VEVDDMKVATTILLIAFVLLTFVGVVLAKDMSGEVTALDVAKGTLTLKSGTIDVGFDCEAGSLIKDVKVGDQVSVEYKEEGGKKMATKVIVKKKKAAGGY
jgi:hypothetical protein